MTSRRSRPGTYREPRPRKEIVVAVLCALGVLAVTAVLILLLQPDDDSPSTNVPEPTVPIEDTTVPPEVTTLPPDGSTTTVPTTVAPLTPAT